MFFAFKRFSQHEDNGSLALRKTSAIDRERFSDSDLPLQVPNSFDIIGNIAIMKSISSLPEKDRLAGQAILARHKNVKTVFIQCSGISGEFRIRELSLMCGEENSVTIHKESGCSYLVDVAKCYFSPRLSYERLRIAGLVNPNEVVVNMFAGVGCFSILIAKTVPSATVYSIDLNPDAVRCMEENIKINCVSGKVFPLLGDAKEMIDGHLENSADRVLMPLPEIAVEYLQYAAKALKASGWIHCHTFEHAYKSEDPREKAQTKISEKLTSLNLVFELPFCRVIRDVGPNWYHIETDIHVSR
jgi:tRNA (guanine37-N1)-methyltransferase